VLDNIVYIKCVSIFDTRSNNNKQNVIWSIVNFY